MLLVVQQTLTAQDMLYRIVQSIYQVVYIEIVVALSIDQQEKDFVGAVNCNSFHFMSVYIVIDSFNEYIKAETLDGDNKYDAGEHGLQVRRFQYLDYIFLFKGMWTDCTPTYKSDVIE